MVHIRFCEFGRARQSRRRPRFVKSNRAPVYQSIFLLELRAPEYDAETVLPAWVRRERDGPSVHRNVCRYFCPFGKKADIVLKDDIC